MDDSPPTGPLAGTRILDLTRLLPGPLCAQYFADLGADVIKIEDTQAGDYARPALRELVNRGKRGIRLNLKAEEGKEVFLALARQADVVIESFRPGTMQRLGAGYDVLHPLNPRLVYCAISGYGQTGPRRFDAGHDINFLALSGILEQTGSEASPALPGFLIGDLAGGALSAAAGILAALLDARRTGQGRFVDVSMADSLVSQSVLPVAALNEHAPLPSRGMGTHTGGNAHYNTYRTRDGRYLAVGAQEKKFWDAFCDAVGCPDLKDHHDHAVRPGDPVKQAVASAIEMRTLAEWMEVFRGIDCCVSPVLDIGEATRDEHFRAREVVCEHDGALRLGLPFKLSGLSVDYGRASPRKGQHTEKVLRELGYGETEIRRLREADAI